MSTPIDYIDQLEKDGDYYEIHDIGLRNIIGQTNGLATLDANGKIPDSQLPTIPPGQIQSDWDQSDDTALDYIKNKPTVTDEKVKQSPSTDNAMYEVLFSGSADNIEHTEGVKKSNRFQFNPSDGTLIHGDSCTSIDGGHAEGYHTTVTYSYSHSEGYNTCAEGVSSHSEGYGTFTDGHYSHAEGYNTSAIRMGSHAEGYMTLVSDNNYSHAEGSQTTATGEASHSEGRQTRASGYNAHSEGYNTTASGYYAHAEGYQTGSRSTASHAEGYKTTASGKYSHSEGVYTSAAGEGQLVIGKYNTPDTTSLFIIGNGTATTARSNALIIDNTGKAISYEGITTKGDLIIQKKDDVEWTSLGISEPAIIMKGANDKDFKFKFSNSGKNVDVGWDWNTGDGAGAFFRAADAPTSPGCFGFYARNSTTASMDFIGYPDGKLIWDSKRVLTGPNGTAVGNNKTPVYIDANGYATALSYTIEKSVPSTAVFTDTNNRKSFYGTCDTAAGTAAKVVTLVDTTGWELKAGTIVGVKFTNTNSASNCTLNVNGSGAKSIYYDGAVYTGSSTIRCGYADRVIYYMYDGSTYWIWLNINYSLNTDTYDRNKYTGTIKAGTSAIVAGNIIVGKDGVFHHLKDGSAFDINYPILYANSAIAANATGNDNYDTRAVTITTTQSLTLTAYKPVYIKGTLTGRMFTPVSTTPLTQTVPTAVDNYHYILLGVAYTTTAIYLDVDHRIFAFYNDTFGELTIHSKTVSQVVSNTDKWRKVLLGEQYEAEDTTAVEIQGRTLVTSIVQVQPSTNTLKATNLKAASNVTGTILGVSATDGTSGGISLNGGDSSLDKYGITFRKTSNKGTHGDTTGDWATYFTMYDGSSTKRGWIFNHYNSGNVASINTVGNAVFNGSVTIGGNAANTSGARMEYNSTNKCIDFVFA